MADKLYGKYPDPDEYCVNECQFFGKFRSIFPLDNRADVKTLLYEFNYKFIFAYDDHISIFKAKG